MNKIRIINRKNNKKINKKNNKWINKKNRKMRLLKYKKLKQKKRYLISNNMYKKLQKDLVIKKNRIDSKIITYKNFNLENIQNNMSYITNKLKHQ